ncbi:Sulfate transport system permease protein CysT [Methyloligella halotolerans]|uniref:Sulfate transport system permease protein CysT n=1 Tax=Methyloligella halotolerans TaxID=1177755 RepID=A0A1E2RYE5_9HYPH|nr:iron ABC transporter permease [Methyloligella halotolerans]ODA67172.1 Sulfate transport system permease protein CysT [Methyloligella halotolerans]
MLAVIAIAVTPILAVLTVAVTGDTGKSVWPHLAAHVLPAAVETTLILMMGVACLTLTIGAGAAWLVTMFRFPGSGFLTWALLLPLAVPTYIVAFCYLELFDYSGLIQTALRAGFGWQDAGDYWFPDIRSLPGAIVLMSAVLYPYVYLTARVSFQQQSVEMLEVSRTLGHGPAATFWRIALPLARPALAAGVALALMETVNDIGAVEFLGVRTLTVAVYDTWLSRNSLSGAAQLASVMLLFVLALILLERGMRLGRRFHALGGSHRPTVRAQLTGWRGAAASIFCFAPVVLGFGLPAFILLRSAIAYLDTAVDRNFIDAAGHSLFLSCVAAALGLGFALVLSYGRRTLESRTLRVAALVPALAYAVPGTVLAIGLLAPLGALDRQIMATGRWLTGDAVMPFFTGTAAALVLAYSIRFLAAAFGAVETGFSKISKNMDAASRSLGASARATFWRIQLPLLRPALAAAALLVFVESMKELPATLLLRPFNFETLATHVFALASLYRYEEAGLAALVIVVASLLPVLLLHRVIVARPIGGDIAPVDKSALPASLA